MFFYIQASLVDLLLWQCANTDQVDDGLVAVEDPSQAAHYTRSKTNQDKQFRYLFILTKIFDRKVRKSHVCIVNDYNLIPKSVANILTLSI